MNKNLILALLGSAALAISACSNGSGGGSDGGGGSGGLGASAGESLTDYDDLSDLLDEITDDNLTDVDTTARTGTATLTGALGIGDLGDDEDLTLIGDLTINANFDTDTATGSATGFTLFNEDTDEVDRNGDVTETLTMSNGTISGTDFDADMDGTLTNAGDDFAVDLEMDGGFYDNGGDLVVGGEVTGTIVEVGSGDVPENVEGGFVATE